MRFQRRKSKGGVLFIFLHSDQQPTNVINNYQIILIDGFTKSFLLKDDFLPCNNTKVIFHLFCTRYGSENAYVPLSYMTTSSSCRSSSGWVSSSRRDPFKIGGLWFYSPCSPFISFRVLLFWVHTTVNEYAGDSVWRVKYPKTK